MFVLGDFYAAASAPYMIQIAQSVKCDAPFIYVTAGFNDTLAPGHEKTPLA